MNLEELKVKAKEELGANTNNLALSHGPSLRDEEHFFSFDNGFGAYVIKSCRDGLYNLGVIEVSEDRNWELNFKSCISHDMIALLRPEDVYVLLEEIKDL